MKIRGRGWSFIAALGVAYVLVLQLLFTGIATGSQASLQADAHAGFTPFDPAGLICLNAPDGTDAPTAPAQLPDCCQLGCQMGAVMLLAASGTDGARLAPPSTLVRFALTPADAGTGKDRRRPQNSRAPPLRA